MRRGFKVIKTGNHWRLLQTGNAILLAFSGRYARLFGITKVCESHHWGTIGEVVHDAECMVNGYYGRVLTGKLRDIIAPVPSSEYR